MAKPAVQEQVFTQFREMIAALILFNDQVSRTTGMNASESQFLHLLQLHGSLSPSDLARLSGLTSGTVTGVLDRLEELGFASRERHPSDRRKVVVTVDQERLNRELGPHYEGQGAALAGVLDQLSPAEMRAVSKFLTLLLAQAPG
ncbi:MAG TPA: MarR family transcriptional regulator [Frankiaceae bacterium]|nr:MarR family transcriptional regulator [Frankiaceae bacterium]